MIVRKERKLFGVNQRETSKLFVVQKIDSRNCELSGGFGRYETHHKATLRRLQLSFSPSRPRRRRGLVAAVRFDGAQQDREQAGEKGESHQGGEGQSEEHDGAESAVEFRPDNRFALRWAWQLMRKDRRQCQIPLTGPFSYALTPTFAHRKAGKQESLTP